MIIEIEEEGDLLEIKEELEKKIIKGLIRMDGKKVGVVENKKMVMEG